MEPFGSFKVRLVFTHFEVYLNTFTFILKLIKLFRQHNYESKFKFW